jgi:spore maturation protein CgeB
MTPQRWLLVLPPEGAARSVAMHTANAFLSYLSADQYKTVDALPYLRGYTGLLRTPDDTIITDLFNQSLTVTCFDFQPTHCLVAALAPVTLFTLQLFRRYGITTAHWFFEDYRRATYWESVLEGYDHFFAIQHGAVEQRCSGTSTAYHFLPPACGCADLSYTPGERPYDTVFIGIPSTYRVTLLETLARGGIRLAIAGSGWEQYKGPLETAIISSSWINEEASFALMQQAKTGINLSFTDPAGGADIHVSPRLFDLMAAGCLPVSEAVPLLAETAPGAHISRFTTPEEAVAAIRYHLESWSPQDTLIADNRELVLAKHRYSHRVEQLMRKVS